MEDTMARRYIRDCSPEGVTIWHEGSRGFEGLVRQLWNDKLIVLVEVTNLYTNLSFHFSIDSAEEYAQLRSLQKAGEIELTKFYAALKGDVGEEVNWRELIGPPSP